MPLNISQQTSQAEEIFQTGEIAQLLDVDPTVIEYWCETHLVTPSVREGNGRGSRRIFNRNDLRQALLVSRLYHAKWKPKAIKAALVKVLPLLDHPNELIQPRLINEGKAFLILCREKGKELIIIDGATDGQAVLLIALNALEEETKSSIARNK